MYYDVVVNNDLNKCEQLYNVLLMINCQQLTNGVVYLREAVKKREPRYTKYAYRVVRNNDNTMHAYLYGISKYEVRTPVELDRFMERTVKI